MRIFVLGDDNEDRSRVMRVIRHLANDPDAWDGPVPEVESVESFTFANELRNRLIDIRDTINKQEEVETPRSPPLDHAESCSALRGGECHCFVRRMEGGV